jgi:pyruvate formate lyase activating enzyme
MPGRSFGSQSRSPGSILKRTPSGGSLAAGIVFDIRRYSIHDGPGIRTTVFLKGCPLACVWCHNPESQDPAPETLVRESRCIRCGACVEACTHDAITWSPGGPVWDRSRCAACGACAEVCWAGAREVAGRAMTAGAVVGIVERDRPFYDASGGGLTLSGGEPLYQPAFAAAILRLARSRGLHTVLDTCGFARWPVLDALRRDVDLFLYDLKLMDEGRHRAFTGATNRPILENLERLADHGHAIVLRVPVIPGITDDVENLLAIRAIAARLPSVRGVELVAYHRAGAEKYARVGRTYALPHVAAPGLPHLDAVLELLAGNGLAVTRA